MSHTARSGRSAQPKNRVPQKVLGTEKRNRKDLGEQKGARPDRGTSGRGYQIDAWVDGGAQHRSDMHNFLSSVVGEFLLDRYGSQGLADGFKDFFENIDPRRGLAHFPAQLEALSRKKRFQALPCLGG